MEGKAVITNIIGTYRTWSACLDSKIAGASEITADFNDDDYEDRGIGVFLEGIGGSVHAS